MAVNQGAGQAACSGASRAVGGPHFVGQVGVWQVDGPGHLPAGSRHWVVRELRPERNRLGHLGTLCRCPTTTLATWVQPGIGHQAVSV
jgi:hypothetical protein